MIITRQEAGKFFDSKFGPATPVEICIWYFTRYGSLADAKQAAERDFEQFGKRQFDESVWNEAMSSVLERWDPATDEQRIRPA